MAGFDADVRQGEVDLDAAAGLLEALPDGIVVIDATGTIVRVSHPLEQMTAYSEAELCDQNIELLVPERFRNKHLGQRQRYLESPEARPMGAALEIFVRRKDGSAFPADIALKPIRTRSGPAVMAVVRDVSERRSQERLLRQTKERAALVEDRERIGRELHDGTIQALFGIGMNLQAAAMATGDPQSRDRIQGTVAALDEVIRDLRSYVFGLKPGVLSEKSLAQAINDVASSIEAEVPIAVVVDVAPEVEEAFLGSEGSVLQFVREALSNVARHAAATTCRVSLGISESFIILEIDDDGHGFDLAAVAGAGNGLRNFETRAQELGGRVVLASGPSGTNVKLTFPVPERGPEQ